MKGCCDPPVSEHCPAAREDMWEWFSMEHTFNLLLKHPGAKNYLYLSMNEWVSGRFYGR